MNNFEEVPVIRDYWLEEVRPEYDSRYGQGDIGIGNLFADYYRDILRYCPERGAWVYFDGSRWATDTDGLKTAEFAKHFATQAIAYVDNTMEEGRSLDRFRSRIHVLHNRNRRETMIKDAKSVFPVSIPEFDRDPMLFNCANGTLDFNTMKFREHDEKDLITMMSPVNFNPDARCPRFERFLQEVCRGDEDLERYLLKALGYALLGITTEECLFILYGATTRNGKSTLMETMLKLAGDYGLTSSPELLTSKSMGGGTGPSENIARLAGKRLCNISEIPKGQVLNNALTKRLCGNDSNNARFLNQNSFDFINTAKMFINTNYLPEVDDPTLFKSGRLKIIPFNRHFTEAEQDRTLKTQFAEPDNLSGILTLLQTGAVMFLDERLKDTPQVCIDCLDEYRVESDIYDAYIAENLVSSPGHDIKTQSLYRDYRSWCLMRGYRPDTQQQFKETLKTKGYLIKSKRPDSRSGATPMIIDVAFKEGSDDEKELIPGKLLEMPGPGVDNPFIQQTLI